MVDQQAAEIRWSTLEQLSKFKATKHKVELWLLFAPSMLPRSLASVDPETVERFADRITAMYGSEDWRDAYVARSRGQPATGQRVGALRPPRASRPKSVRRGCARPVSAFAHPIAS